MAEKKIKWTEQQKRAIFARGSDLLVTASAGTGKTEVLSGRCANIVSDKVICPDIWSVLVLTFTDMAAEQMRSRIADQLRAEFQRTRNPHLRKQIILLQGADISTIHSFCKRLITEYFYKLGLDPTFAVIDSDEARLLKAEALERTIDWAWRQSNLQQALAQLLYRRDLHTSDGFLSKIIDLSDFLDGVISRGNWYERAIRLTEAVNPFTAELGKKQKQMVADRLQHIRSELCHAKRLYKKWDSEGDWAPKCEDTFIKPVEHCIELLESGDWEKCAGEIRDFQKPRVTKPRDLPPATAELIQRTVKKAIDSFAALSQLALLNPDYLDRVSGSVSLQTRVLIELVRKFDQLYKQAKRAVNCLDFADLEHYALRLLAGDSISEDTLVPSETALALQQKYKYIFVDEYQDINPVQQAILDMLSSGGNVLEVGDIKQSIYAFRGAEPDIFLKHLKLASADPEKAQTGLRVDLNVNFRSAKGILNFVNKIFSRIMTAPFAKIDYDESAQLRPAPTTRPPCPVPPASNETVVEFHILDETSLEAGLQNEQPDELANENLNVVTARQRQAAMIARRIKQMVGAETGKPEFQVYDKQEDEFRDVQYLDIVVLMRSLAKKANDYVEVFRLAGVPVSCQATAGYFEATEITDLLCLLKVLDNPQRDIELAAVLRSPFFKLSDTELAKIRVHGKTDQHRNFYDCVAQYSASGPDVKLAEKLKEILLRIKDWRTLARRGNLADLIWQIYRETGFLSFVSALPNGQARKANLLKLHDRAVQFEGFASSAGIPSLTRFVEFIEKLQEIGQDWSPAEPEAAAGNAVRILSVHKSKGLEFPVVFLAELDSKFNKKDIYADCLADADHTLGLQIIDRQSNSKLQSLAHQVIAEQKLSRALAEEMRILYVATTRARDRLILTASEKQNHCRGTIVNGFFFSDEPIPDWQLRTCQSPLDWILYGLCDQKALHNAFETGLAADAHEDDLFSLELYRQEQLRELAEFVTKLRAGKSRQPSATARKSRSKRADTKLLAQVKKSLAWRYRFGEAPLLPAKQSVTQLTHRNDEYVKFDYSRALDRQPRAVMIAEYGLTEPIEGRVIGVATHLLISQLDLGKPINGEAVQKAKEKLLANGAITEVIARTIDTESIMAFFHSELGRLAVDSENSVWREWAFTFALPACEFPSRSSHEPRDTRYEIRDTRYEIRDTTIVQGIIDMLIRTPQGLIVIDFKTDDVTAEQVAERAELYRLQFQLYGRAASAILKSESIARWLYFLSPRCSIEV
jgi:ATP-dependent helicase/nuclease subunit A